MAFNRKSNNLTSSIPVLAITIGLVAGQSATQKSLAQFSTSPPLAGVTSINGAGDTSVSTLFVGLGTAAPFSPQGSWFNVFGVANPLSLNDPAGNVNGPVTTLSTFRYALVGSGAEITAFFTQTPPPVPSGTPPVNNLTILPPVSFAGTEGPLAGADIERVVTGTPNSGKAIQVPVVGVGIALAYNPTGLNTTGGIRFSRATYCAIFNGTITNWNDSRITTDNGRVIAANRPLRIVRRSDSSGSTFVLSSHLNTVCKTTATPAVPAASVWNRGVGLVGLSIDPNAPFRICPDPRIVWTPVVCWPIDPRFIAASGGRGVASAIVNTPGAIGYVDNATRLTRSLPAAILRNRTGNFVAISSTSITEALVGGTIVRYGVAPANRLIRIDSLVDPNRPNAYPISTASYALFYDIYTNNNVATGIRAFINWALGNSSVVTSPTADAIATSRGYAPLPSNIKTVVRTVVLNCVDTATDTAPCS